jgi:hypothetical protein
MNLIVRELDRRSALGGEVARGWSVPQITMHEPAMLYRKMSEVGQPGRRDWETVVARGPFIVMAHGYLAFDPEHRASFCIRSETREVSPEEIEQAVRDWNARKESIAPES